MKLIGKSLAGKFEVITSDTILGKGGEGSVYEVISHTSHTLEPSSQIIAKIYHEKNDRNRGAKVASMVQNPPKDLNGIAWPLALLMYPDGAFAGYIMERMDKSNWREWLVFSNAKDRKKTAPDFSIQYALTASRNFVATLKNVHEAGHKLGDINESNILISGTAETTVIDTDSAQITRGEQIFYCPVAKPEYLAPELIGKDLKTSQRTGASDIFATAVMVFQILANGHPTDGVYTGDDDPPSTITRNQKGIFPGLSETDLPNFKKLPRIQSSAIPKHIRALLLASLQADPSRRPTITQFLGVFDQVLNNLVQCDKVKQHWFDKREGSSCVVCAGVESSGYDHWNPQHDPQKALAAKNPQNALPALNFGDEEDGAFVAPRAPVSVASGSQALPQAAAAAAGAQAGYPMTAGQIAQQMANQPQNAAQGANQEEPELPKKYKGKMILDYIDGTRDVRPPIPALLKSNPKMAIYCMKEETPVILQAWWSVSRKIAPTMGTYVGFGIALLISLAWLFILPLLENPLQNLLEGTFISPDVISIVMTVFTYGSVGIAVIASVMLLLSALNDKRKAKKQYGSLDNLKKEDDWKTILRFVPIAIFYGPIFFIVLIFLIISGIFNFLKMVVRNT